MRVARTLDECAALPPPRAAAVGTFDGVHLGHRAVLAEVVRLAREMKGEAAAVVFREPPRLRLAPSAPLALLTAPEQRLAILERLGLDLVLLLDFDESLARLTAGDFFRRYLVKALSARALVLGPDARLGRGGGGGPDAVAREAEQEGLTVRVMPPTLAAGAVASSTAAREAVAAGRLDEAAALLGRRHSTLGVVVPGRGRGRTLGFPTANVSLGGLAHPPGGAYAAWTCAGGRCLASVAFVDARDAAAPLLEVHLLDGADDLYDLAIEVEFVRFLRPRERFDSDAALIKRIALDAAEARAVLAEDQGSTLAPFESGRG